MFYQWASARHGKDSLEDHDGQNMFLKTSFRDAPFFSKHKQMTIQIVNWSWLHLFSNEGILVY